MFVISLYELILKFLDTVLVVHTCTCIVYKSASTVHVDIFYHFNVHTLCDVL